MVPHKVRLIIIATLTALVTILTVVLVAVGQGDSDTVSFFEGMLALLYPALLDASGEQIKRVEAAANNVDD